MSVPGGSQGPLGTNNAANMVAEPGQPPGPAAGLAQAQPTVADSPITGLGGPATPEDAHVFQPVSGSPVGSASERGRSPQRAPKRQLTVDRSRLPSAQAARPRPGSVVIGDNNGPPSNFTNNRGFTNNTGFNMPSGSADTSGYNMGNPTGYNNNEYNQTG